MKKIFLLFFSLISSFSLFAQSYSFKNIVSTDNFEVQPVNDGAYCLFRASEKNASISVFKKVFLNAELKALDSVNYFVEGQARLLSSCSNETFVTHAFYSSIGSAEKITFIVTDHTGKIQSTFSKSVADFAPYFPKPEKKLRNIHISFLANHGSPEMLLVQPYQIKSGVLQSGKIFSMRAEDGKEIWTLSVPPLYNVQTTGSHLVGLTDTKTSTANSVGRHQIQIVDKASGNLIKSVPLAVKSSGNRDISVFATNGYEIMVAGSEFESGSTKDGRFYMTLFNLDGEKTLDKVDSSAVLSTRRLHILGSIFDQDGNLVLIGEGWKPDATRAIAATAGSVALAILSRGAYTRVYAAGVDHKIENVTFAKLSPTDGKLKSLKVFPIGPWLTYGRLMTQGGFALIQVNSQVFIYDVNDPDRPPSLFTSLRNNEGLVLTPFGPIISKKAHGVTVLSRLR